MEPSFDAPVEAKKKRILEIRQLLLTSEDDDERLLTELNSMVSHPEPTDVIFNMERYPEEEFFDLLLNHKPLVLP